MVDKFLPEQPDGTEGLSGIARVAVTLDAHGHVVAASIAQGTGNALLDAAAVDAAKRSTYHSARANCEDIPGSYIYRVDFNGS